jgi:hypothetical protein
MLTGGVELVLMNTARTFADECVGLAEKAPTSAHRDKLLQLARTWLEVAERVDESKRGYDVTDRAWLAVRPKVGLGDYKK